MKFTEMDICGVWVIEIEPHQDQRGFFARSFCETEFQEHGLETRFVQCNIALNHKRGTLRGMHYQREPHQEVKLIRCTRGAVYDVALDLRKQSPTFGKWFAIELTEENRKMLYIPRGCAHGYQTLVDNTELFYQVSEFYHPESEQGVRWNDPAFNIQWRMEPVLISKKDRGMCDWDAGD